MSQTPQSGGTSDRTYLQQRLPFTNADVEEALSSDQGSTLRGRTSQRIPRSSSFSSATNLSSSYGHKQPTRSYFHHASHGNHEPVHYSSQGVREQTQELASWVLGESPRGRAGVQFSPESRSDSEPESRRRRLSATFSDSDGRTSLDSTRPTAIPEVSEPESPEDGANDQQPYSILSSLFKTKRQPVPQSYFSTRSKSTRSEGSRTGPPEIVVVDEDEISETTALLEPSQSRRSQYKTIDSVERQWTAPKGHYAQIRGTIVNSWEYASHPGKWDVQSMFKTSVGAVSAVFLGVLLNVLDALSYGMILFPLGESIFENTGPDGISMFYVSCIISQVTYSLGGSAFKGGVGSEMIEVVPFFHKMAYMILDEVGENDPESVMATTILSYAISSILTGVMFLLLGALRLGDLVSFFPRSILLGCIGGVGVFLFLTGIEVSAGLDSSLGWGIETVQRMFYPTTLVLWVVPLLLAILLMIVRKYINHPVVMPAFFISVVAIFYIVCAAVPDLNIQILRDNGWIFKAPQAGVPYYNFYSYYKWNKVNWDALFMTVPTMFALSFFGIIHVPINVPALGIAVQQDDVNINRELFGHGLSNAISGFVGSIQNYLVFANSRLFIQNGGNSRLVGLLLALATTGVWIAGPAMIGYIPIMIVGTLIFMLGIEMVQEALWDTFGKLQALEWQMILAITVVMGFYDFVVGIVLGIVLACLIFVVQTSRTSPIRAIYSGTVAESTVRRHPLQRRFLNEVGSQIKLAKLTGYLFFGSIVAVEKRVRAMIDEDAFARQPIRYLIVDFDHVQGLDFSAAEAFVRMNRVLQGKGVEIILSGVSISDQVGKALSMVGLLEHGGEDEDYDPPRVFETLNQALEACENELLLALKERSDELAQHKADTAPNALSMSIPTITDPVAAAAAETLENTPRSYHLNKAATTTLADQNLTTPVKWNSFAQPLPLILQAFKDVTTKDYEFWHRAVPFFMRRELTQGAILFSLGDIPRGLYLLEDGILRADYELAQGRYTESIVAGTTCGELPFFSDSRRTATVVAETDAIAWTMDVDSWEKLQKEQPEVATELLKVAIKLTNERMNSITSYVLVMAS